MKLSILGICVLLAGAPAMAAPQTAAKPQPHKTAAAEKPKLQWASGSIEKYDAAAKTLTVKHDGKETTFVLTDQTHVMKGKQTLNASELSSGQHARVEYAMSGANREAHVIELSDVKTAKK
jgi:phage baseplate assembly protein gpV